MDIQTTDTHIHYRYMWWTFPMNSCGSYGKKIFHAVADKEHNVIVSIYYYAIECFNELCEPTVRCVAIGDASLIQKDIDGQATKPQYVPSVSAPYLWMFGWIPGPRKNFCLVQTTLTDVWRNWHTSWTEGDMKQPQLSEVDDETRPVYQHVAHM